MGKSRNKQGREKKTKRKKHPELGRLKLGSKSLSSRFVRSKQLKLVPCSKCNQLYKNYKFIGGRMIRHICKCNEHLLEEESNRIRENRKQKELNRPIKCGQIKLIKYND